MNNQYEVFYIKPAQREYDHLDGSQKVFVDKAIARIERLGMTCGEQLKGELHGCNKLKNRNMGLRIVFQQVNRQIKIINIIAIGKRADSEVYRHAVSRLKN